MKPTASLSLDLDNKWSYMKTHGDEGWETFPSYLDVVVPRVLQFLKDRNLHITFFIVGQDAALEKNQPVLKLIAEAGHEIGNHSFHHEPWLHLYAVDEIEAELANAEKHIEAATGQKPQGFRGPGYSLSYDTLRVLHKRGYRYDCSTFPTYLGPLARMYYFMTTKLTPEEKRQRAKLFGTFAEGLRSTKPYRWKMEAGEMVEIPVTTMPIFKIPIHVSYLLYLSMFSPALARFYFRVALLMCSLTRTAPSMLLHPLDFLGCDDTNDLSFFPAMRITSTQKIQWLGWFIDRLIDNYNMVPMRDHAAEISRMSNLPLVEPHFNLSK